MKLNFLEQIRTPVNVFFQKVIDVLRERGKGFLYLILKINDAGFVYKPVAKDVIADSNINGWLANLTANRLQFRINRSVIMKEIKLNRCAGWTDAESVALVLDADSIQSVDDLPGAFKNGVERNLRRKIFMKMREMFLKKSFVMWSPSGRP